MRRDLIKFFRWQLDQGLINTDDMIIPYEVVDKFMLENNIVNKVNIDKKLIYIGSPYTHKDKRVMKLRFDQITAITAHLVSQGYVVFSPITYGHTLCEFEDMPTDFNFWNEFCLKFLHKSDLFIKVELDGYEDSKGLTEEYTYCINNNIPHYTISPKEDVFDLDYISKSVELALDMYLL